MTICAHRPEVLDRIYGVFLPNLCKHPEVMDVYKVLLQAVSRLEIEPTNNTRRAVVRYACPAGFGIPLVSGYGYAIDGSFVKLAFLWHFSREQLQNGPHPTQTFQRFSQLLPHNPAPVSIRSLKPREHGHLYPFWLQAEK